MGIHHVVTAAVTAAPYAFGSWTSRRRQESGAETSTSSREGVDDHWRGSARSSLHGAKASASSRARSSPEIPSAMLRTSSTLDRVPEDDPVEFNPLLDNPEDSVDDGDDEDEDWQAQLDAVLDEQGLYEGSYRNLLFIFTFVPLTFVAALAVAALLLLIFPPQFENPFPYTRVSPSPLPEILTGVSLWSLIYLLRNPLSSISIALIPSSPTLSSVLFSLVHGILSIIARLAALSMLLIAHYMEFATPTWKDAAFTRVWWIALGWAFAEGVVAVQQGYACLALYRDVLVIVKRYTGAVDNSSKITIRRSVDTAQERREASVELPGDIRWELEQDVDQLIALRNREELEEIYGVPFIRIPVFVPCLQRFNSVLLSIGFMLLLSAAWLQSPVSRASVDVALDVSASQSPLVMITGNYLGNRLTYAPLAITLPVIVVIHSALNFLDMPPILPRLGVHTVVYVGSLVSLGVFFSGLGMWGVLT